MTENELTLSNQNGYHEYMAEPGGQEQLHEIGRSIEAASQQIAEGAESISQASKTLTNLGRDLYEKAERGETETEAPPEVDAFTPEKFVQEGKKQEGSNKTTKQRLTEIARDVTRATTAGQVHALASEVAGSARVLKQILETPGNEELKREFKNQNLYEQAERVQRVIENAKKLPVGARGQNNPRAEAVLAQAGEVAKLAKMLSPYYESAKIAPEQFDPYRNISSFEELMTYFTVSLGGSNEEVKFQPGEDFELIEIEERVDEFGREMKTETAHPENFLRWIRERVQFYHDFDPLANIDLFKGIYIVAGYHRPNLYEMTVDFSTYFAHRVPTTGDLTVTPGDVSRALNMKTLIDVKEDPNGSGVRTGKYKKPGSSANNPEFVEVRMIPSIVDEEGQVHKYNVVDMEGNPIQAILQDRMKWNTKEDNGFNEVKNEILYELWLMTYNHNMDVDYRQKGMASEKLLNEAMANLYSVNILTRTRSRILFEFNMPSTTKRGEEQPSEAAKKMDKTLDNQGSVGKAFQRSLAAYYHLAEANATFNGYKIDGKNPFKEVLRKGDIEGSDIFYKSVITQGLEREFGYGYDKAHPENSKVAAEFLHELNSMKIQRTEGKYAGSFRDRYDWEKAALFDLLFFNKQTFLEEMGKRGISTEDFQKVGDVLTKKYRENPQKLRELQILMNGSQQEKRRAVFEGLREDHGNLFKADFFKPGEKNNQGKWTEKPGFIEGFILGDEKAMPLDDFAVRFFHLSFPKSFNPDLNVYANISYALDARDRVRQALRDVLIHTEKLDAFEALYADEWAFTMTYYTGISARNDTGGIGHDAWSKVLNTEWYRLRQTSGGNYPGNLDNLYGIHRLGLNFWEGLKVQVDGSNDYDHTLYEMLVGMDKDGNFDVNKNMPGYEFYGNAMRQLYADHINHAIDLFTNVTSGHEFNFDKVVAEDTLGRVVINHSEMQKMIDTTWKHLRYAYDNRSFLYDSKAYGWWMDESINEKGQVSRKPHFGMKSLRELMFSEEIREMGMYYRQDVSGWANTPENQKTKMARNVFAYLIKAQLEEHTKRKGEAILYSADQISLIADAFMNYAARVIEGKHGEALVLSGFFSPDEIYKILFLAHAILWKLYAKEYGMDFGGGIMAMIIAMMQVVSKDIGSAITLAK